MVVLILSDGVYNDEHNRAQARKAGELHDTLPNYGMTLIASGLAKPTITVIEIAPEQIAPALPADVVCDADDTPVTIDLRDGVSDEEARIAGQALKRRRKRK